MNDGPVHQSRQRGVFAIARAALAVATCGALVFGTSSAGAAVKVESAQPVKPSVAKARSLRTKVLGAKAARVAASKAGTFKSGITAVKPLDADVFESDDTFAGAHSASMYFKHDHTLSPPGDRDYRSFWAIAGETYFIQTIDLLGHADTYLYLYGTDGTTVLAEDDDSGTDPGGLSSLIEWTCPASGTYYFCVEDAYGWAGAYTAIVRSAFTDAYEEDDNVGISRQALVELDQFHFLAGSSESDWHYFDAIAGRSYCFETDAATSDQLDTYLTLYDTDGTTPLDSDDDGGTDWRGLCSLIDGWQCPTSGRYYIRIEDVGASTGGGYRFRVTDQTLPDMYEDDDTIAGAKQCLVADPGPAYWHTFDVAESVPVDYHFIDALKDRHYRIETEQLSGYADTGLTLYDTDGTSYLDWDDDSGGGLESLIDWTCPATGRYFFAVENYGGQGGYRVRASEYTGVVRVSGADRYAVAANMARKAWYQSDGSWVGDDHVIVACGEPGKEADPLAAAGLAGVHDAPILLVRNSGSLPSATRSVISEMAAANSAGTMYVHIVGGTASVPGAAVTSLRAIPGVFVQRIKGADRYEVTANIAKEMAMVSGSPLPGALIICGEKSAAFYDALAASPLAYTDRMPMLAVRTGSIPSSVRSVLSSTTVISNSPGALRYVVSGPTYISNSVWNSVHLLPSGARFTTSSSRYTAASDIASTMQGHPTWGISDSELGVSAKISDALGGGAFMGKRGGVMLYTSPSGSALHTSAQGWLRDRNASITQGWVFGGDVSVPEWHRMAFELWVE